MGVGRRAGVQLILVRGGVGVAAKGGIEQSLAVYLTDAEVRTRLGMEPSGSHTKVDLGREGTAQNPRVIVRARYDQPYG